ncbi:MAG: 16S rRNA (adenine(1518)-N(6)/adenine(1519)-N(6))-dimethyltransferase RsmA [Erysipelotrichaceae bacterium]|nr:16S rRNA (adenine(1518)-N(6)/adenine(1519)-N(6))-dimethyltransferase RsmA [Erysipelotrichaceae bacterium]
MISNINYVKEVLGELKAKKKFGQNFLIDSNVVDKIAKGACDPECLTIEIGPGLGALSEMLLKYSKAVDAYEIDRDMYDILNRTIDNERFKVTLEDFLDTDLSKYENEEIRICSNLPYYVTTPILFKLFNSNLNISKITVMVQKEVADRFKAPVNSEDYNALSLIVQYLYNVKLEMNVPKGVFYPQPKVDSAVISFTPKIVRNFEYEKGLFEFIEKCFMKRRKTLNNNLRDFLDKETIEKIFSTLSLKESVRAQELTLDEFIKMYEVVNNGN